MHGWWYYYFVALAVKVPLGFWLLVGGRIAVCRRLPSAGRAALLPAMIVVFLAITAAGSSRNYGLRYILPLAPLAVVWVSGLAEGGRWMRRLAALGMLGQAIAVASIHPYELSYFNELCGGPRGGRHILADSNLDWGQGLRALARLQREQPQYADLTLYYFGNTDPYYYRVQGQSYLIDAGSVHAGLPPRLEARTKYVAVSASLQWGPWGPEGYFERLDDVMPERLTEDATIAIYRWPPSQYRSRPRESRSSSTSAASAIRRTRPEASRFGTDAAVRFWIRTKYSSPRSTLIAKWPSTLRAFSFRRMRASRSLAGPQTETSERIARPSASVPARPT
jgi:hypothetical protein